MSVEKEKIDIIYFIEQFLGVKLQLWQKELLRKIHNGNKQNLT